MKRVLLKFADELGLTEWQSERLIYVYTYNDYLIDSFIELIKLAREVYSNEFVQKMNNEPTELITFILNPNLEILQQKHIELLYKKNFHYCESPLKRTNNEKCILDSYFINGEGI